MHSAVRLTVAKDHLKFSAAHMTLFPDGTKERMHGHNFYVTAELELAGVDLEHFVDLGHIKKVLKALCGAWNEHLMLPAKSPVLKIAQHDEEAIDFTLCGKRYVLPSEDVLLLPMANVTVETLAQLFTQRLAQGLEEIIDRGLITALWVKIEESNKQGAVAHLRFDEGA